MKLNTVLGSQGQPYSMLELPELLGTLSLYEVDKVWVALVIQATIEFEFSTQDLLAALAAVRAAYRKEPQAKLENQVEQKPEVLWQAESIPDLVAQYGLPLIVSLDRYEPKAAYSVANYASKTLGYPVKVRRIPHGWEFYRPESSEGEPTT